MAGLDSILSRRPPTTWDRFLSSPLLFLANCIYKSVSLSIEAEIRNPIRIVCISDTHNTHHDQPTIPSGDVLIHAGDLTQSGSVEELDNALAWLNQQTHPNKIFIAGNHDVALASADARERIPAGLSYLENSSTEILVRGRKLHIYGSPNTPKHGSWPFQYPRVHPLLDAANDNIWSSIPPQTDILITHGPPFAHLDLDEHYGCYSLLQRIWHVRPRLHIFGHIHAGRGVQKIQWDQVQRAYEDVLAGRAKWGALLRLLWYTLMKWSAFGRTALFTELTTFANAAAIGGLRDEERLGAVIVDL